MLYYVIINFHLLSSLTDAGSVSQRSLQAPQSMRWALRQPSAPSPSSNRQSSSGSSANPPNSSGLIYIDPVNLRRSNAAALNGALNSAVQSAAAAVAASQQSSDDSANQSTMSTANNLSIAFGIILRQVTYYPTPHQNSRLTFYEPIVYVPIVVVIAYDSL